MLSFTKKLWIVASLVTLSSGHYVAFASDAVTSESDVTNLNDRIPTLPTIRFVNPDLTEVIPVLHELLPYEITLHVLSYVKSYHKRSKRDFVNERLAYKDIKNLSLVSKGFRNWADQLHLLEIQHNIPDIAILELLRHRRAIQTIKLSAQEWSEDTWTKVATYLFQLRKLKLDFLHENPIFTINMNQGLFAIAKNCPGLSLLKVDMFRGFNQNLANVLARTCKKLKSISFTYSPIDDAHLTELANGCPQLSSVMIHASPITDASVQHLVLVCKNLRTLMLAHNESITPQLLTYIATNAKSLERIEMDSVDTTDGDITQFMKLRPDVLVWGRNWYDY